MTTILLLVEHDNQQLKSCNAHVLTAAKQLKGEVDLLICGYQCQTVVEAAQTLAGIRKISVADDVCYQHFLAENISACLVTLARDYDYILAPATTFGKNCLPRAAALLDVAMISDVIQIVTPDTFVRPIYAGNALATIQSTDKLKLMTIRTTAFAVAKESATQKATVEALTNAVANPNVTFKQQALTASKRPELTNARIVISGGRGLKSAENFRLLEEIADCLGAAIGASRAAVDAGYAPNDYQVGQTGKVVAPDLYIAVGISGAIQHMAGMKDSKVIVAINSDPDAPIFQVADYGIVGDLFTVLPQLKSELAKVLSA